MGFKKHASRGCLALALLIVLAIAALLLPAVQTALLRKGLERAGAQDIELRGVRALPAHASVATIRFRFGSLRCEMNGADIRFHPWGLLRHYANLESVAATHVRVILDLAPPAPAVARPAGPAAPTAAGATPGAPAWESWTEGNPHYALPWRVRIGTLHLAGSLDLRQNGRSVGAAAWKLSGAIAPGESGAFDFALQPTGTVFSVASGGAASGTLRLREDAQGGLAGFGLAGKVDLGEGANVEWDGSAGGGESRLEFGLHHLPLPWANPYLRSAGLAFSGGDASVAGTVALKDGTGTLSDLSVAIAGRSQHNLVTIEGAGPLTVRRADGGEWLLSADQPLRVRTARLPLAGLNPWLAPKGFVVAGTAPATDFDLALSPRKLTLHARTPWTIAAFHLERDGQVLVPRGLLTVTPAAEITVNHRFTPLFQFRTEVTAGVAHGRLGIDHVRAGLFDAQVKLRGDERNLQPTDVSGGCWFDLGALGKLPLFAAARLPGAGHFRMTFGRASKDARFVEFHGAVEDLKDRTGAAAPTLRIAGKARADVSDRVGGFGIDAVLEPPATAAAPHPRFSDAHFGMRLDLRRLAVPQLSSRLTGNFVNVDTVRAFASAFAPANNENSPHPPVSGSAPSAGGAPVTGAPNPLRAEANEHSSPYTGATEPTIALSAANTPNTSNARQEDQGALRGSKPERKTASTDVGARSPSNAGPSDQAAPRVGAGESTPTAAASAAAGPAPAPKPASATARTVPWGFVEGKFTLGLKEVSFAPYTLTNVGGVLEVDASHLALKNISGDLLGGRYAADLLASYDPDASAAAPDALTAHFSLTQLDAAQAVRLRYPTPPPAGIDGRVNLDLSLTARAARWDELISTASGHFTLTAQNGQLHLTLPRQDMLSGALLIGGTLSFSKEMRALGRLLKTLQTVPLDNLRATGTLTPPGELELDHLQIRSPQLEIDATGEVANAKVRDLLSQPLHVDAALSARGDLATILDGMHLLDARVVNGFRSLRQPFTILGQLGQPDLHPFYDLLAQGVEGSHGTWGMLMRAVQARVPKEKEKEKR